MSRDIDSTSENVLHDWERDDAHVEPEVEREAEMDIEVDTAEPAEHDDDGAVPAWGAASPPAEHEEAVAATTVETEPEDVLEPTEVDEVVPELEEGEIDETPMHVELCLLYTSDACLLYTSPSPRDRS